MNLEELHQALSRLLDAGHGKARIIDERNRSTTYHLLKSIDHVNLYDADGTEYHHGGIRFNWSIEASGDFADADFTTEEERRKELKMLGLDDNEIDNIQRI